MKKVIYFAGGCFWGTQRVFQLLDGVLTTRVGYANGNTLNPTYKEVCTDTTGFRETVEVTYDDSLIPLTTLLDAYFLCVDPTVKNRQGHDIGSQYQTGVYYTEESDLPTISAYFEKKKKEYPLFCVELDPLKNFYEAEEYHQDYLIKNPEGYCHVRKEEFEAVRKLNQR